VIDDVGDRQQAAILVGGAAQLREQILAAAFATLRHAGREIGDDLGAATHAARHARAGQR